MVLPRKWLAPEVLQAGAMDCGPAALQSLLGGFGLSAPADKLRAVCATDEHGTSTDALQAALRAVGLDAEQVLVPADHLPLTAGRDLPAVLVLRRAEGG